jgi:hypothetical protein
MLVLSGIEGAEGRLMKKTGEKEAKIELKYAKKAKNESKSGVYWC